MGLVLLGISALALFAVAAKASSTGIPGVTSAVPIPSDSSLIQKYGIFNPAHNILLLAQQSLQTMRVQYAAQTTSCAKQPSTSGISDFGVANQGIQVGTQIAEGISKATSAIPLVGGIVSDVVSVIGGLFDRHAQAAAREQATLCAATAAVNQTLDQFDQLVSSGQISSPQYKPALQTIYSRLVQMDAGISEGCPPSTATGNAANVGNEACIVNRVFQAIAEKRLAQLGIVGMVS